MAVKTDLAQAESTIGHERATLIRRRVEQLVSAAGEGDGRAKRRLQHAIRQLASLATENRLGRDSKSVGKATFLLLSQKLASGDVPVRVESSHLADACILAAANRWLTPTKGKRPSAGQAELLRITDAAVANSVSSIRDTELSRAKGVAHTRKKRYGASTMRDEGRQERSELARRVVELDECLRQYRDEIPWLQATLPQVCRDVVAALNDDCRLESLLKQTSPAQFGKRLRKFRIAAKLTQQGLAELAGTFKQNISEHEKGLRGPRLETVKQYASALECQVEDLLFASP